MVCEAEVKKLQEQMLSKFLNTLDNSEQQEFLSTRTTLQHFENALYLI